MLRINYYYRNGLQIIQNQHNDRFKIYGAGKGGILFHPAGLARNYDNEEDARSAIDNYVA